MVLASLKEAIGLMKYPVVWLPGVVLALIGAADLAVEYYGGTFLAGRLWILEIVVLPFFFAGFMASVKNKDFTFRGFLGGGKKYYFRVLLPAIVILIAAIITVLLLLVPLSLIGIGSLTAMFAGVLVGVAIPFIFLTYFYDAVAVFGDEKVFESIRKSIELTMHNTGLVIKFFLVNIVILFAGFFVLAMIWTLAFVDKLTPLTTMNSTELQNITPDFFVSLLGPEGIIVTLVIFALGALVITTVLYSYKACFYKVLAGNIVPVSEAPPVEGEYDKKGRWYKY